MANKKLKFIVSQRPFWAKIYLSGPIEVAEQIIRKEVFEKGLCVTINPTKFIYTGGEEQGYEVGLINYPRFPSSPEEITERAMKLTHALLEGTYQDSALFTTPDQTVWMTRREGY